MRHSVWLFQVPWLFLNQSVIGIFQGFIPSYSTLKFAYAIGSYKLSLKKTLIPLTQTREFFVAVVVAVGVGFGSIHLKVPSVVSHTIGSSLSPYDHKQVTPMVSLVWGGPGGPGTWS